jgi:hypothetical protein
MASLAKATSFVIHSVSPGRADGVVSAARNEDSNTLNTSFVERHNLTIRQGCSYPGRRTSCHARQSGSLLNNTSLTKHPKATAKHPTDEKIAINVRRKRTTAAAGRLQCLNRRAIIIVAFQI